MWQVWAAVAVAVLFMAVLLIVIRRRRATSSQAARWDEAKRTFRQRREWLEARFVTVASQSGKPRGLLWRNCDFADDVTFARDRQSGALQALIAATIEFEAEIGGGMEDVEAVSRKRAATAVFEFDGEEWVTSGRVVFNLSPVETIQHFRHELERVDA